MASDNDRIRVAVALAALKFKPRVQSFSAYVLDLRSQFAPVSLDLTLDGSWRRLALTLEREFAALNDKYEAAQLRCAALENAASSSSAMPNSSSEQPATTKKRPKKKTMPPTAVSGSDQMPLVPTTRVDLNSILEDSSIRQEMDIPRIASSHSLFSGVDSFLRLTSLPDVASDLLLSVTLRTIEAAAQSLRSVITPPTRNVTSDLDTLESLGRAVHQVLSVTLPLLASPTRGSLELAISLLDRTTSLVLYPLIRAFSARSETFLSSLFLCHPASTSATTPVATAATLKPPVARPEPLPVDVRPDMLSLFRMIFCCLDGQTESLPMLAKPSMASHTLRASLILETVREIDKLLSTAPRICTSSDPTRGLSVGVRGHHQPRSFRVKKLATKDSLWFLCTVLHTLFCEPSSMASSAAQAATSSVIRGRKGVTLDDEGGSAALERRDVIQGREERLLSEGVSDALVNLIARCKRPASRSSQDTTQTRSFPADGHGTEGPWTTNLADGISAPEHRRLAGRGGGEPGQDLEMTGIREIADGDMGRDEDCGGNRGHAGRSIDVGVVADADVGDIAAGPLARKGRDQAVASLPQNASNSRDEFCYDQPLELDEVDYGMLLGVMERYWIWSKLSNMMASSRRGDPRPEKRSSFQVSHRAGDMGESVGSCFVWTVRRGSKNNHGFSRLDVNDAGNVLEAVLLPFSLTAHWIPPAVEVPLLGDLAHHDVTVNSTRRGWHLS
ncbi:hypothetical protein LshimejAT787_0309190 [Lyophyllum shimeji]|uniref:Uncharacterized protein n=1 Tax=Lyophyllum shimeji TaxID=47721 RepID=A0A9P3PJN9_LYOSH|nr:hypothetical protein LshimejAT787_0309190 [Lyophyllum shimeji]